MKVHGLVCRRRKKGERREREEGRRKENKHAPGPLDCGRCENCGGSERGEKRDRGAARACSVRTAQRHGSAGSAEGLSASRMPIAKAKDKLENCKLTKSLIPSSLTGKSIGTKACLSLSPRLF